MQKSDPTAQSPSSLFSLNGIPPAGQLIPLGLQHVVAAVVGVITPALIISGTCELDAAQKTLLVQASLVMTAIATLLQLFPIFHKIGSGLPVIMGTSFAYVPTLTAIGKDFGLSTILGAEIIGGAVAIVFGLFAKQIRKLFPPVVTGTVIFTIGLSLYPTAVRYMAGGSGADNFGSVQCWIVALITFAVVVVLNNFATGILKQGSLLFGMIVGYAVALPFGLVSFSSVGDAGWFALPRIMPFKIEFVPAACASLAIVYVVNAVQTIGDLSSTTMGGMDRLPTDEELSGGIIGQGLSSIVGAFFGGLPTASYSQNVGIITLNRVINRSVFTLAAGVLLVAGFVPKFSAILTTIPQSVIGGATLSVFATITMTGIQMFTQDGFTFRKKTVVGLSVALGVGITQVSQTKVVDGATITIGSLQGPGFPAWVHTVFGSSAVVVAAIMAIILNLTLPKDPAGKSGS